MVVGLMCMVFVVIMLLGIGMLVGIIVNFEFKDVLIYGFIVLGLLFWLLVFVFGVMMLMVMVLIMVGMVVVFGVFFFMLFEFGVFVLVGVVMIYVGVMVLDYLLYGSFFYVMGGSVNM